MELYPNNIIYDHELHLKTRGIFTLVTGYFTTDFEPISKTIGTRVTSSTNSLLPLNILTHKPHPFPLKPHEFSLLQAQEFSAEANSILSVFSIVFGAVFFFASFCASSNFGQVLLLIGRGSLLPTQVDDGRFSSRLAGLERKTISPWADSKLPNCFQQQMSGQLLAWGRTQLMGGEGSWEAAPSIEDDDGEQLEQELVCRKQQVMMQLLTGLGSFFLDRCCSCFWAEERRG